MSIRVTILLACGVSVGVVACELPPESIAPSIGHDAGVPEAGSGARTAEDYAIVVLPDTQYYASSWPDIFVAQTRWIVDNRQAERIAFVLHTGDIVDSDVPGQWEVAAGALRLLDGQIPYAITAGNHDYFNFADRMGLINTYFPPSHFADYPWFGDTFEAGHLENSFGVFSAGTGKWLVLALEFGSRDEALAWAAAVLKAFHDTPAIVITHAYLYRDGARYDTAVAPHQEFNPHDYVMMGQQGTSVNDGAEIWRKLIQPNANVKLVFSGHDVGGKGLPSGTTGVLTSARQDGSLVHQILANYQTCLSPPCETFGGEIVRGGNGFLRVLRFSPATHAISVTTYSPYTTEYAHDPANEFTLPMD